MRIYDRFDSVDGSGGTSWIYPDSVPSNTVGATTNYLQVTGSGGSSLKKRITIRKFDEDGKVIEETITEEYGDKEVVTIPSYPDPYPWYQPNYPYNPMQPQIWCGGATSTVDINSATC